MSQNKVTPGGGRLHQLHCPAHRAPYVCAQSAAASSTRQEHHHQVFYRIFCKHWLSCPRGYPTSIEDDTMEPGPSSQSQVWQQHTRVSEGSSLPMGRSPAQRRENGHHLARVITAVAETRSPPLIHLQVSHLRMKMKGTRKGTIGRSGQGTRYSLLGCPQETEHQGVKVCIMGSKAK